MSTPISQHPDPATMEQRVRAWMSQTAERFGLPDGRLAEVFAVAVTA